MYLEVMLIIAPGFIAKTTSKLLGNFEGEKQDQTDSLMGYFAYSLFSLFVTTIILILSGIIPDDKLTLDIIPSLGNNWNVVKVIAISVVSSFIVGASWQLFIKSIVLNITNKIYGKIKNGNSVYNGSFIVKELNDGQDHLLRVLKDGKEIAVGRFLGISSDYKDQAEIAVESNLTYKLHIEHPDLENIFFRRRTYVIIKENIVVEEFAYPEGFFDGTWSAKEEIETD